MGRENKKAAVAALHRQQILSAAEKLFAEKGFEQTTIGEISEASAYSRRTIYAYYTSKEDIERWLDSEDDDEGEEGGSGDDSTSLPDDNISQYSTGEDETVDGD